MELISEHTWKTRQSGTTHRDLPVANHALPVLMIAMMKHGIRDLDYDIECKFDKFLDDVKKSDWHNEWQKLMSAGSEEIDGFLSREDWLHSGGRRAKLCT